jgi:energy-coupling factor transport system substrate-specific component
MWYWRKDDPDVNVRAERAKPVSYGPAPQGDPDVNVRAERAKPVGYGPAPQDDPDVNVRAERAKPVGSGPAPQDDPDANVRAERAKPVGYGPAPQGDPDVNVRAERAKPVGYGPAPQDDPDVNVRAERAKPVGYGSAPQGDPDVNVRAERAKPVGYGPAPQGLRSLSTGLQPRGFLTRIPFLALSLLGIGAFLYPFVVRPTPGDVIGMAHADDAPLVFFLLIGLGLVAVLVDLEARRLDAKTVALLGVLSAINAVLRLVPGPAGFAAVFFLPILCGYAYGGDFGLLLGVFSLFISALITGGVGPWLPYQMFATGWVGLSAGWLPRLQRWPRAEVLTLAGFGFAWGMLFGAIMNLWFWPYLDPGAAAGGAGDAIQRYAIFYGLTSAWWDLGRAGGNALLILLFGAPILRLLYRFRRRFQFSIRQT